jgi:CRISPR type IV-associated protein Csf3
MNPLQITAHLSTPIAVSDDWTPNLENLLTFLILDETGIASPNPTDREVAENLDFVRDRMPLQLGDIQGEWYWEASAPHYQHTTEIQDCFHKRWDCQDQHLDWQGKRAKWSGSEGHTKSWTVPVRLRNPARIDWFVVGDRVELERLLGFVSALGKKKRGQVCQWQVAEVAEDWHLFGADGQLMRSVPVHLLEVPPPFKILNWAWRPPAHLPSNCDRCWMPGANVVKA